MDLPSEYLLGVSSLEGKHTRMNDQDKRNVELEIIRQESEMNAFTTYMKPLASRTRKRQSRELAALRAFLLDQGHVIGNIANDPASWREIKATFVEAYVEHLQKQHYQYSTIDKQLDTIKIYARLAMDAGYLPEHIYKQIHNIQAPPTIEGEPRRGEKRGQYLDLTDEQVHKLLDQPDTRQGRNTKLLLALLLKCGFWPREIAALDRHSINTEEGTITFYNYHSEEQQTLHLDSMTLEAATRYLQDPSPYEALFVGNHKDSTHTLRLTDRAINARVRASGKGIGVDVLAPQDCHAYWEKSLQQRKLQRQPGIFDTPIVTERPPRRKQRPDVFNRRAFEESMLRHGVPDSMLARFVSEYRLFIPLMIQYLDKQKFLDRLPQDFSQFHLKVDNLAFLEEALEHISNWMNEEMDKYRASRECE